MFNRSDRRIRRAAALPASLMLMGVLGATISLMQICIPIPRPAPALSATATASPATGTDATPVTLTATAAGGTAPYTYAWTSSPSVTITNATQASASATLDPAADTTYTFTVTVTDAAGATATAQDVTAITVTPAALTVNAGTDQAANGGDTVTLTALATNGTAPIGYAWQVTATPAAGTVTYLPADGIGQSLQATFSADAEGTFTFQVTATDSSSPVQTAQDSVGVALTASGAAASFTFTLGVDSLTGTAGNDAFSAPLIYDSGAGGQVASLQTGDSANGAGGADSLTAFLNSAAAVVPSSLAGIETFNLTSYTANSDLDFTNVSDATTVTSVNSTETIDLNNVGAIVNLGVTNSDAGIQATFEDAALTGTSDEITVTLSQVSDGANSIITLNTSGAVNGFETLNVVSTGSAANVLRDLVQGGGGTSLATIDFSGAQDLEITNDITNGMANLDTIDGADATGALELVLDTALDLTVTTGSGDDEITFGAGDFNEDDTVDLGTGDDILTVVLNASVTTDVSIANTETLSLQGDTDGVAENFTLDVNDVTGITTIRMEEDANANDTITLRDLAVGSPNIEFRGDGDDNNQIFDSIIYDVDGATDTTSDSMTITINNRGTDGEDLSTNDRTVAITTIDVDKFETVSLTNSDGGEVTITNLLGADIESLTLTSSTTDAPFEITNALGSAVAATTVIETVDASGVASDLTVSVANNTAATDASISSGGGDDTLIAGPGADEIDSGAGDDTITGGQGDDTITGGTGDDTYVFTAHATNGIDSIAMETGDTDGSAIDDVYDFRAAENLDQAAPTIRVEADADITAGGDSTVAANDNVIILTGDYFANAAALDAAVPEWAALNDGIDILVIYSSDAASDARIAVVTVNAAGDITAATDVAILEGLTVGEAATGFVAANFLTD